MWELVGGVAVVVSAYVIGVQTRLGRHLDATVVGVAERASWPVRDAVHTILVWGSVPVGVTVTAACVLACRRDRRRGDALRCVAIVVGAQVATEALKLVLPRPGGENTLPSGHVTLVVSLVLAIGLATPRHRRLPACGLAGLVAAAVTIGTWSIGWHRPSDAVAAVGVVCASWGAGELARPRHDVDSAPGDTPARPIRTGRFE